MPTFATRVNFNNTNGRTNGVHRVGGFTADAAGDLWHDAQRWSEQPDGEALNGDDFVALPAFIGSQLPVNPSGAGQSGQAFFAASGEIIESERPRSRNYRIQHWSLAKESADTFTRIPLNGA
jgi:hypothetical protein